MELRKGDRVEVLTGKRQGTIAMVTEIQGDRALVEIDGISYEVSYLQKDLKLKTKASKILDQKDASLMDLPYETMKHVHGDDRVRVFQRLVREKKICPSWPYTCNGTCDVESGTVANKPKVATVGNGSN